MAQILRPAEPPLHAQYEHVLCNLCGSDDFRVLFPSTLPDENGLPEVDRFRCTSSSYGLHLQIVKCCRCGLVYSNPRYDSSLVRDSYQSVKDPLYEAERDGRLLTYHHNLRPLDNLVPDTGRPRRLLDVGCHIGALIEVAQEMGWQAQGVEPSRWAAERGLARGLYILNSTLSEAKFPSGTFDAVTIWDVIEHLTDPRREVVEVRRVLRPGGIVAIHTIDIESFLARWMGSRWPWLMEMHLYYFSPRTLARMLQEVGFEVESIIYQGRYLRLGYLTTRLAPYSHTLAHVLEKLVERASWRELAIPVNFRDLFTILARAA